MKNIIATTLRAPETLLTVLRQFAEQQGHTTNALILQILWDWVNTQSGDKKGA